MAPKNIEKNRIQQVIRDNEITYQINQTTRPWVYDANKGLFHRNKGENVFKLAVKFTLNNYAGNKFYIGEVIIPNIQELSRDITKAELDSVNKGFLTQIGRHVSDKFKRMSDPVMSENSDRKIYYYKSNSERGIRQYWIRLDNHLDNTPVILKIGMTPKSKEDQIYKYLAKGNHTKR